MPPTIVAGFDPETADEAPLALGRLLAAASLARLLVVAVRPGGPEADLPARAEPDWPPEAARTLTALRERTAGARFETVDAPSAASGLHAVLEAEAPLMLVLGSRFSAPFGYLFAGSTGERLLGAAPCAVALAPCGYAGRTLRVIVAAARPGPEEDAAVGTGAALARGAGAALHVVTVVGRSPAAPRRDPLRRLYVGDPAGTLLSLSQRADLIVLGSRSYGPERRVLAGGVARAVLAGARCPVLVVPRAAQNRGDDGEPGSSRLEKYM